MGRNALHEGEGKLEKGPLLVVSVQEGVDGLMGSQSTVLLAKRKRHAV